MKLKEFLNVSIFIIIYYVGNLYIGVRILQYVSQILSINKYVYWCIFVVLASTYIVGRYLRSSNLEAVTKNIRVIGSYWLIVLFFGLTIFPITDICIYLLGRNNVFQRITSVKSSYVFTLSLLMLFLLEIAIGSVNARKSYVDEIQVNSTSKFLREKLNIVMVSDIHLGDMIGNKRIRKMVEEINCLNPDLVVIAGDIVDTEIEPFMKYNMAKEFSNIQSKYGVFATLGNHDVILGKGDLIANELRKNNVIVLRNEAMLINDDFYVIGRDDSAINKLGIDRKKLKEIVCNLDNSKYKIVIDHTPNSIDESKELGIDLHLSGHTHKGQIAPFNLFIKGKYEIDHGYKQKDDLNVIVSSGYGTWGPPIRIGSKSEIMNVFIE